MRSIPMPSMRALIACVVFLAVGCGGDPDPVDAGPMMTDAGPMTTTDAEVDGATPPTGDGNDSFADADMLDISGDPATVMARIGTPGDRDYYRFDGTAGQWLILSTDANPDGDPMMVDTVITLYDSSMTMIAENDDAQPRNNTDSEIVTRLPADGTYYVLVQEWSQWANDMPFEGQADYNYELSVARLNVDAAAVTLEAEAGDDVASAQALGYNVDTSDFGILVGDFRDDSDVDVFSFTVTAGKENIRMMMMPSGAAGYGSTTAVGRMWITNADGTEIIARVSISESTDPMVASMVNIQPNLPPGDYNFFVENGGAPGSNGFYVLKLWRFSTDNDPETDDAANDDPTMAQALSMMDDMGTRRGFVLARVGDGDTDHFSFDVMGTEQINVFCGSATAGSGVQGLTATVLDSTGAPVPMGAATETASVAIAIRELAVSPGTYLLRLTKTGQDAAVTGTWVRCGVGLAPPAPAP